MRNPHEIRSIKASRRSYTFQKACREGAWFWLGRNAGRGDKGYHSRSGSKHRPWFEGGQMPLHRRVPKRGFSNFLFKKEFQVVNVSDLELLTADTIDSNVLKDNGLVKYSMRPIKILGTGDLTKKLNVTANSFSKSAKEKIEKAGGSVTEQ